MTTHLHRSLAALLLLAPCLLAAPQAVVELPDEPLPAIALMPVQPAAASGTRVRVVDGADKPVANASVVFLANRNLLLEASRRPLRDRIEHKYGGSRERLRQLTALLFGTRYVTDDRGETQVPQMTVDALVIGVRGYDFGMRRWARGADGFVTVRLTADGPIHVRVIGAHGRPVRRVPVMVWQRNGPTALATKTDRTGRAVLRLGPLRNSRAGQIFVRCMAVTRKPVEHEVGVDFVNDADEPIVLTLPEFGRLRVQALDPDGKIVEISGASVYCRGAGRIADRPTATWGLFDADSVTRKSATFTAVELGLELDVACNIDGVPRPRTLHTKGPVRHREVRVVTIEGVTVPKRVRCRLLGLDGKPVANEVVGVMFVNDTAADGRSVTTDGDGKLSVVVPQAYSSISGVRVLIERRGFSDRPAGRVDYAGSQSLPLSRLVVDAGIDVRLAQDELVAAGRVVDAGGKPVAGVHVSAGGVYGSATSIRYSGPPGFFSCANVTDADGRFELRVHDAPSGSLKLDVELSGYQTATGTSVAAGADDARVVILKLIAIRGRIRGLRGLTKIGQFQVLDRDGRARRVRTIIDADGSFALHGVPPGRYTVAMSLPNAKKPFLTVDEVEVVAGQACRDSRLSAIDFSEYARVARVRVVGPNGEPVAADVWHWNTGRGRGYFGERVTVGQDGAVLLIVAEPGNEVSVYPEDLGLLPQRVKLEKDLVVTLEAAVRVEVAIRNMPVIPKNLELSVRAFAKERSEQEAFRRDRLASSWRFEGSVAKGWVAGPGELSLQVLPALVSDGGRKRMPRGSMAIPVTVPKADGDVRRVEVVLTAKQVEWLKTLIGEAGTERR